jgi:MoaA/NifB/PqqE/SkfB family radical SAM enzyme
MNLARAMRFALMLPTHRFTGVDLILTRSCNLGCRYCGVIEGGTDTQLSPDQWKRVIDYFRRNGHVHFIFTGGEALLYKGLPDLVAYTARRSLTCLMTNGKTLTGEILRELPGLDFLTLSLDPVTPDPDDSGKHGFDRLDTLRSHADRTGLSVSVMATVTRRTVSKIPELARMLSSYRFPLLLSLYHAGSEQFDFRTNHDELDFRTPEDLKALEAMADELISLRRQGYLIGETDEYLQSMVSFKRGEMVTQCRAGIDWFEVDCDGRIKACHDAQPSSINALDEPDYRVMREALRQTRPSGCRCMYDFYFNAEHLRTRPISYLTHVWRTRHIVRR